MQVTLRPRGIGRLLQAAFLGVWLGGWAMGEWFALALLAAALEGALGPGLLPAELRSALPVPVPSGEAPMLLAFVVPWLGLWTLGGAVALGQALLLVAGREVVRWGPDALEVERHALVRISSARIEPTSISRFSVARGALLAVRRGRSVAVARLGSDLERSELATRLEAWHRGFGGRLGLGPDDPPCEGYSVSRDEAGALTLTPARNTRWLAAGLLALIASGLLAMLGFTIMAANAWQVVAALFALGMPGAAVASVAVWLAAVRETWHPRPGSLAIRRRAFGRSWTRDLSPLSLELRGHSDPDGDLHWTLFARAPGRERRLASVIHDPAVPEALADWLSARTGVPVEYTGRAAAERPAA